MNRTVPTTMLAVALLVALSGCSSIVVQSYQGGPSDAYKSPPPAPGATHELREKPSVAWVDHGRRIAVTTVGSSSCPGAPDTVTVGGAASLIITIKRTGGPACTADFGPTTFEVARPKGLDLSREIRVTIGEGTVDTLPPLRTAG